MAKQKTWMTAPEADERVQSRIAGLRNAECCNWCKDPNRTVQNKSKGLCSRCYRWDKKQRRLAKAVAQSPAVHVREPNPIFLLRLEYELANAAIEDCKRDGVVRRARLEKVEPIDLEHLFGDLYERALNKRRGSTVFHGSADDFTYFSPAQRILIWQLIFGILAEMNSRERGRRAFSQNLRRTNRGADARVR